MSTLIGWGLDLLEIVGLLVGEDTALLVAVYALLQTAALAWELWPTGRAPRVRALLGEPLAFLALLGQGYLLVFAAATAPLWLLLGCGLALGTHLYRRGRLRGAHTAASGGAPGDSGRASDAPPVDSGGLLQRLRRVTPQPGALALFVALHLLLEGTAGHVLTPWQGPANGALGLLSQTRPLLFGLLLGALLILPWAPQAMRTRRRAGLLLPAVGLGAGLLTWLAPSWGPFVGALAVGAAGSWLRTGAAGSGLRTGKAPAPGWYPLGWLQQRLAPLGLIALAICTAHYGARMWRCPTDWPAEVHQLSQAAGAFSLALTQNERHLVASLRDQRRLLILDLERGQAGTLWTGTPADPLWGPTEPENVLALGGGQVLVLLAKADDEQGNRLALLDLAAGRLFPPLPGLGGGVSDIVRGPEDNVWAASEYDGRLHRLPIAWLQDPASGPAPRSVEFPEAETNKVVYDATGDRLWSVGLWEDDLLRRLDPGGARTLATEQVGTHQWDLAWSPSSDRLYLPRLMSGRVDVFEAESLEPVDSWSLGFGLRPIETNPEGTVLYVGNLYRGTVEAVDAHDGRSRWSRHLGGHLKALYVSEAGRVFAGSNCGVFELLDP